MTRSNPVFKILLATTALALPRLAEAEEPGLLPRLDRGVLSSMVSPVAVFAPKKIELSPEQKIFGEIAQLMSEINLETGDKDFAEKIIQVFDKLESLEKQASENIQLFLKKLRSNLELFAQDGLSDLEKVQMLSDTFITIEEFVKAGKQSTDDEVREMATLALVGMGLLLMGLTYLAYRMESSSKANQVIDAQKHNLHFVLLEGLAKKMADLINELIKTTEDDEIKAKLQELQIFLREETLTDILLKENMEAYQARVVELFKQYGIEMPEHVSS